tara:strand:+ start:498 stop:701 length:204 start_codon:yes stop_codon:yes gene_type:complete
MFISFVKAVFKHVSTGAKKVSKGEFAERLSVCYTCEHRIADRCGVCGCFIEKKAAWKTSGCPKKKWQ